MFCCRSLRSAASFSWKAAAALTAETQEITPETVTAIGWFSMFSAVLTAGILSVKSSAL